MTRYWLKDGKKMTHWEEIMMADTASDMPSYPLVDFLAFVTACGIVGGGICFLVWLVK